MFVLFLVHFIRFPFGKTFLQTPIMTEAAHRQILFLRVVWRSNAVYFIYTAFHIFHIYISHLLLWCPCFKTKCSTKGIWVIFPSLVFSNGCLLDNSFYCLEMLNLHSFTIMNVKQRLVLWCFWYLKRNVM